MPTVGDARRAVSNITGELQRRVIIHAPRQEIQNALDNPYTSRELVLREMLTRADFLPEILQRIQYACLNVGVNYLAPWSITITEDFLNRYFTVDVKLLRLNAPVPFIWDGLVTVKVFRITSALSTGTGVGVSPSNRI